MKKFVRTTSLKNLMGYLVKIDEAAKRTNVCYSWSITDTTNMLIHVDVELTLIVEGLQNNIDMFDYLIDPKENNTKL